MSSITGGLNRDLIVSAQVDKERAKLHKWQMMTNKVESAFQKNLVKFQQEIKKRKERI
jgi:hypothetical protein